MARQPNWHGSNLRRRAERSEGTSSTRFAGVDSRKKKHAKLPKKLSMDEVKARLLLRGTIVYKEREG